MTRTAILNVVGLTEALIGEHTPNLSRFKATGSFARIEPAFPAVTCTAQSNYLTGQLPRGHGIVGNGWYHRELAEVHFWKQSNRLVLAPKLWETLACDCGGAGGESSPAVVSGPLPDPPHRASLAAPFACAQLFWWFNMFSSADYTITPRPMYPADGRKVFDIYTQPDWLRRRIQEELGPFPFATFWGPAAGVDSPQGKADAASRWIADAARWVENQWWPTLHFIYLPHLDYNLQRWGPFLPPANSGGATGAARVLNPRVIPDLKAIDAIVGDLVTSLHRTGVRVVILSEYGITNVRRPIHLNRLFREQGGRWLALREELGLELLNPGASEVFAIADHQVAHIYLNRPGLERRVRDLVESRTGATVLGAREKAEAGIDHPRAGDLVAIAPDDAWFTYYYWLDDAVAPDFARTVDIHRKPGYDPVELFADPALGTWGLKARIAWRLLQKRLGFRMLMDVIPLDASLVKGSHGRRPDNPQDWPVLMVDTPDSLPSGPVESTEVYWTLRRLAMHRH